MIVASWTGEAVSGNRRLVPGKGRLIADLRYKSFKTSLAWTLKAARATPLLGPVFVRLELELPARMDTDAVIKSCLDALQLAGVVENDRQVTEIEAVRVGNAGKWSTIRFYVKEAEGAKAGWGSPGVVADCVVLPAAGCDCRVRAGDREMKKQAEVALVTAEEAPCGPVVETKEKTMDDNFAQSFDAKDWAKAFCERFPQNDEGTMIGWFANAIMRGFDEAHRPTPSGDATPWIQAVGQIHATACPSKVVQPDNPQAMADEVCAVLRAARTEGLREAKSPAPVKAEEPRGDLRERLLKYLWARFGTCNPDIGDADRILALIPPQTVKVEEGKRWRCIGCDKTWTDAEKQQAELTCDIEAEGIGPLYHWVGSKSSQDGGWCGPVVSAEEEGK